MADAPRVDRSQMIAALRAQLAIDPGRTAVVLVDAHRGHLDPQVATMPVAPDQARRVRERLAHLVTGARAAHVPVLHVVLTHSRNPYPGVDSMGNPFWRAVEAARQTLTPDRPSTISGHNLEGSVQTEIVPEVGPDRSDVVIRSKKRLSAFYGTELEVVLRARGIATVAIAGINTNTCVLNTAFDAFNRDFQVIVIGDAVASMYGDDLHVFGLENISRALGWVLSADEFVRLLQAASSPAPSGVSRVTGG